MNQFDNVEIPYGAYWSTPFAKWQGSLQHLHSLKFAAHVARAELARRRFDPLAFDFGALGMTINQFQSFYGASWPFYEIGMRHVTGPCLTQVCATGPRLLLTVASEIQLGLATVSLALGADRLSNGPHLFYPAPSGPGGTGVSEDQTLYNFSHDPVGNHAMVITAENVARKHGITLEEQHEIVLRRYAQYQQAIENDHAFQKRYMTLPFPVPKSNFKADEKLMTGDEGIAATSTAALARLKAVVPDGTVTFGSQTHPADGNCGIVLTTPEKARDFSRDTSIRIRILSFGQARVELGFMPEAPIPASRKALEAAEVSIKDIKAVKSHNPFAVNDIVFARGTGFDLGRMNNYGSPLIWGHAHAATGLRAVIELIEELVLDGGGLGLFQGCAAGDSAMALVLEVSGR